MTGSYGCVACRESTVGICPRHSAEMNAPRLRPYRCPVCEGRGFVPVGFYGEGFSLNTGTEPCRAGCANGVLWKEPPC